MNKGACWKSDLDLHQEDDETESQSSTPENYGDPAETPVGPFMRGLFDGQLYTDVEFAFPKSGDERLSAHRVVLAAKCEFFADLLFGEKTSGVSGMKMRVDISNVSPAVFRHILNYFYTDDIDFPDLSTALDIHTTADCFKMHSLVDLCEKYTDELELTEDNACSTLQIANVKSADRLKNRCLDFIKNHAFEVISSPDFEKCSFNTVREISSLQDLNLRGECEMLEAVTRWVNVQPDHAKPELRKSLMKCIRFTSFTPGEFHGVIKQHPELLTSGEALDTLIYLNDPTAKNLEGLPEWMNKSRRTFLEVKKNIGLAEITMKNDAKIEIPLATASAQNKLDRLTSFLQMKCLKGDHRIKGMTIKLEDITNNGNMVAVIVVKAIVIEKSHNVYFSKKIDSKEAAIQFNNVSISSGQTFHLEVEIIACQSCNFFQFDSSKEDVLTNEHFQCSVASRPKQGMYYFIQEILFEPLDQKTVPKNTECPPKVKKTRRVRRKRNAKLKQDEKQIFDSKTSSVS